MAGLQRRFDFDEQASTDSEEGRCRPDVTVRLPGGGMLVIDAKVSLTAFLEAQECLEEGPRDACLVRFVASLREHVRGLSANAEKIATVGRELYKRLAVMGEHAAGVGRALGAALGA